MASGAAIRSSTAAALALSLLISPHVRSGRAAAQAEEAHTAEALFDQGRQLMASEQYEQACTKFSASHRLDPAVGTLLNLGYCWKQMGKAASAWTAYREAASLAYWQRQREREAFARSEAAELEARLARLTINVTEADHPGLELRRNGTVVPRDVWGVEVPVDPGEYTIEAVAPDRSRFATKVSVQAAAKAAVSVPALEPLAESASLPEGGAAPGAQAASSAPMPATEALSAQAALPGAVAHTDSDSVLPALAIGVGSAGLVAFGVAGFFALRMQSQDDAARSICPDDRVLCRDSDVQRHEDRKESAHDSRTAAFVSAGIGAACAIGAVVLLVAAPDAPDDAGARVPTPAIAVGVAPGELMVVARGRL